MPDLLDAVIAAETEGKITPTELRDMVLFLFVAGYDTSKNQLAHIMNFMLDRPAMWERCARRSPLLRQGCRGIAASLGGRHQLSQRRAGFRIPRRQLSGRKHADLSDGDRRSLFGAVRERA